MRRVGLVLGLAGVLGAVLAMVAGPAVAGGPTSVLLVAPDSGRSAALHVSNPVYEALMRATDGAGGAKTQQPPGQAIRLTWLIHDVQVWRIDEVYADAPGGPWIATRQSWNGNPLELDPVWHRSAQPKELVRLLTTLKVRDPKAPPAQYPAQLPVQPAPADDAGTDAGTDFGSGTDSGSGTDDGTASGTDTQPSGVQASSAEQARGTDDGWVALAGWRWALAGLLAGAGLTYLTVRLSPGWQRRDRDPRVELIDESKPATR